MKLITPKQVQKKDENSEVKKHVYSYLGIPATTLKCMRCKKMIDSKFECFLALVLVPSERRSKRVFFCRKHIDFGLKFEEFMSQKED